MNRTSSHEARRHGRMIQIMLGLIFLLFIGILVALYFVSKSANPIMLDESGKPVNAQPK